MNLGVFVFVTVDCCREGKIVLPIPLSILEAFFLCPSKFVVKPREEFGEAQDETY